MIFKERENAYEVKHAINENTRYLLRMKRNRYLYNWLKNKKIKFKDENYNLENLRSHKFAKMNRDELISNFVSRMIFEHERNDFIVHVDKARKAAAFHL